jgi:hypothetical protein
LKSTLRIASDARYILASAVLVTTMGVFASLGSVTRNDNPYPSTPAFVGPNVIEKYETVQPSPADCTCGSPSTDQPDTYQSSSDSVRQSNATAPAATNDCTCSDPPAAEQPATPDQKTENLDGDSATFGNNMPVPTLDSGAEVNSNATR